MQEPMKFTLFKNVLVMSCLLMFQTKVASNTGATKNNKPPSSISENLLNWNNHQKIKLLSHQLIPINYLEKHPKIKGLLIYHYLGTGKTFLAIGYAERNPNKKIVIFAPRFLKYHWLNSIKKYGVKNPNRYKIVTHKKAGELININLSSTITIIDESHKILAKLTSSDPKIADLHSRVYLNIQKSYRILSLTGTPIFKDITDLSYQVNLVAGKIVMPYNEQDFKVHFMEIDHNKSALVGHIAESHLTSTISSITLVGTALAFGATGGILPLMGISGYFIPKIIKTSFPVRVKPLRSFNPNKLEKISSKYISYYNFNNIDSKLYPTKEINYKNISYNNFQNDFLIRFADNKLTPGEIVQLQADQEVAHHSKEYIELNITKMQNDIKKHSGSSLGIGNLTYKNPKNLDETIYPYKFKEALDLMLSTNGPVVLYSHFYHNGILLFKKYLDFKGQKGHYKILEPSLPIDKYEDIINRYNAGKLKFLLLHPEIIEGISLKGTRQLHILEVPFSRFIQEQVIGRAIRYKSHIHLPETERHVDVYIWKPTFSWRNLSYSFAIRENWLHNFSELSYYGARSLIDPNSHIKDFSPDDLAYMAMQRQNKNMKNFKEFLEKYSIETEVNKV